MPYAKTSLRAEQRAVREKMRGLGMSYRQVAAEFTRCYRLRPRAAWRHAYGWSLAEAAARINAFAARVGLDPDGSTVTMTGPHLCEYENWPGPGSKPMGRRPAPYLLSLLASVYECTVHDLLDVADYERMPAADRLIIDRTADGQQNHQPEGSPHGRPAPLPSSRIAPLPPSPGQPGIFPLESQHVHGPVSFSAPDAEEIWLHFLPAEAVDHHGSPDRARRQELAVPPGPPGEVRATATDVAMIRGVLEALTACERRFGGGKARTYAVDYLRGIVRPRLRTAGNEAVFSDLRALAAEFSLRVSSMQLDAGSVTASRKFLGAGLSVAQETGSPIMLAWVLARLGELDMREKNTVFALPSAGVVIRIATNPAALRRVATSIAVTRWLASRDFPCTVPADVSGQPFVVAGHVVSVWRYVPTAASPPRRRAPIWASFCVPCTRRTTRHIP